MELIIIKKRTCYNSKNALYLSMDQNLVSSKIDKLKEVAAELKEDFIGLDQTIDQIMDKLTSWHLFPQYQTAPLVINLWGITGTGKTELVRSLAKKLEVLFVEHDVRNLPSEQLFEGSNFEPEKPFIYLIDEFQSARTIAENGFIIRESMDKNALLWSFLNDGTPARSQTLIPNRYLTWLIQDLISVDRIEDLKYSHLRVLHYHINASKLQDKQGKELVSEMVEEINRSKKGKKCTQALVFICGNLDEAYSSLIGDLEVLDADELSLKVSQVSVSDAKSALMRLFRAEQVARLGNNHIMFPSFTKQAYQDVIEGMLLKTRIKVRDEVGVALSWDDSITTHIFNEGAIPSQGIRNLSSLYKSVYDPKIVQFSIKALIDKNTSLKLKMKNHVLIAESENYSYFEKIESFKKTDDLHPEPLRSLVAVHEAGHAALYWILNKKAPQRVVTKSVHNNTGGYVKTEPDLIQTKKSLKNSIIVTLGGFIAEELVNGKDQVSTGAYSDLRKATDVASKMIREFGMGTHIGQVNVSEFGATLRSLEVSDDKEVEQLLQDCLEEGRNLLRENREAFDLISNKLKETTLLTSKDFLKLLAK